MLLSNVNIGTGPSAGDGDPLRSAFATINTNFQIITNNVNGLTNSVTSVAGRTGNVVLTVNDVIGAASIAYVNSVASGNATITVVPYGNSNVKSYLTSGFDGDILPSANVTYSLGSATQQWKDLWVSNNTIYIGSIPLTVNTGGELLVNGTPVGGTITGNITAGNSAVNFVANSSGDGLGLSTIQLHPDTALNTDQYIVIDPTAPSHIHIRAGGTQDASTAELYLGGERNNVRVYDNYGVRLNNGIFSSTNTGYQTTTDFDTAVWSTDESDNHWVDITISDPMNPTRDNPALSADFYNFTQYPENRLNVYDGVMTFYLISNGQAYTLGNPYQLRIGVTQAPPNNPLTLSTLTFELYTLTQSVLLLENNSFEVAVNQSAYVYADQAIYLTTGRGNLQIVTDDNTNSRTWNFGNDGKLTLTAGSTIRDVPDDGNAQGIIFTVNSNETKFDTSGRTHLPNDLVINYGGITFPDTTVQTTAYQLVTPPLHSTGASGDKVGMVAYNADYHYYCKANYVAEIAYTYIGMESLPPEINTYGWTNQQYGNNTYWIPYFTGYNDSNPVPQEGWTVVINGQSLTIASISSNPSGFGMTYILNFADPLTNGSNATYTQQAGSGNIWVRTGWTDTSW